MADDIAVDLLLTRDGIDVTSSIVGGRILNAPAGDYVATWTASSGALPTVTKTEGLTVEETPDAQVPTIIGSIADRTYTVGQAVSMTDLRTKFTGATSYVVSPTLPWVFINGYNLVFDASSALEETAFAVRGVNADGQSEPVTFNLTISVGQQAPSVQTPPTLSGGTTVGSILTRTAGTATGIPTPSRATVWLRNGEILNGQTGNTLDTSGFAADDIITTRDVWTNSQGSASGTSEPWTLTVQPALTAVVTPNPIVMGEPFTVEFNEEPDSVTGSPPLTGSGTDYGGTGPATSPASIGATKAGFKPYSEAITVDTAVITPTAPITAAAMYETQTIADIPGIATKGSPSGYTLNGNPPNSVDLLVGRYSGGVDQVPVLGNFEAATTATALDDGDVTVARVTYSGRTPVYFILALTEYALRITQNPDGTVDLDINDLVPGDVEFPITDSDGTSSISRNDMADGEEIHVLPTLTGTAEVGETLIGTAGKWFENPALSPQTLTRTITADGATVATIAEGDPLTYVVQASDAGKALRLVEALGGSTAQSAAVNIPVPVNQELTYTDRASQSTTAASRAYTDRDIGAPAANRDVFVIVSHAGSINSPSTGCVINGVTATPILNLTNTAEATPVSYVALYHARVPTGTLVTINTTRAASSVNEHITVLVGYDIVVSDTGQFLKGGTGSTMTATLDAAEVGHKVFAYTSFGRLVTFTGATEVFDYDYGGGRFASLAETVAASAAVSITASATTPANAQGILMVFSAGAA